MLSKYNQIADQTSEEILAGLEAFEAIYQEIFESTSAQASDSVPADAPAGPEASDRKRHPTELSHYTSSNQFLKNSRSRASHHLSSPTSWLSACYVTIFGVATPIGTRPVAATPGSNGKSLSS